MYLQGVLNLRKKTVEKRKKFLNVGRQLFFEKGYINVSVKEICDEVGTTTGSFYFMFCSKEKLLEELLMEDLGKLWNIADEIKEEKLSLKEKMNLYFKKTLDFITKEVELLFFYENLLVENGIGGKIAQDIKTISFQKQEESILDIFRIHKDEIEYDKNYLKSLARYTVLIFQDKYKEIVKNSIINKEIDHKEEIKFLSSTIEGLVRIFPE